VAYRASTANWNCSPRLMAKLPPRPRNWTAPSKPNSASASIPCSIRSGATAAVGHHPRRDPGQAHQERERGGEVLTETAPGLEQEAVDWIATKPRRAQGVDEWLLAEVGQRQVDDRAVAARRQAPSGGQLPHPAADHAWQLQPGAALGRAQPGGLVAGIGACLVTPALGHRHAGEYLEIGCQSCVMRTASADGLVRESPCS